MNYEDKFKLYLRKIHKTYPDLKFKYEKGKGKDNNLYTIYFIDYTSTITILENSIWKEIKLHIDKIIFEEKNPNKYTCEICYNNSYTFISCNKCSNKYCRQCYFDILRERKGIIICPYCRHQTGDTLGNEEDVEDQIQRILIVEQRRLKYFDT